MLQSIKVFINTNIKDVKKCIKERWVYYLIGYVIQLSIYGFNGWKALFPMKIMGIGFVIVIGNCWTYDTKKKSVLEMQAKAMKYTLIMLVVFFIIFLIQRLILAIFGFNILPLIGW